MCFAPRRRALFQHLNAMLSCRPSLNKVRTESMFWSFSLENVLCATTVCTFSTSQLPKLVRIWCVFIYVHDFYVLFTFWLPNALRATVAHTVSIWAWGLFDVLTFKSASRYNGVKFLISHLHLPRWFSTRHFSEPTFWSSRTTKHWKSNVFSGHSTFSRACIFLLLILFLLCFFFLLFSSLTLPTSTFLSVHIVGNLVFKFPSATLNTCTWRGAGYVCRH